jgi:hypothetical protein
MSGKFSLLLIDTVIYVDLVNTLGVFFGRTKVFLAGQKMFHGMSGS